ncbi:unnamed protein product [Heterobilharzia americana]|nr:unnamed protein product [Heterobilharzia americana]
MERQKSFEVLDFDGEFFKQNENSTIESTELISDGVSHDESRSYTELSESDYSENSLSASKSDLIKLDFDQNQTIVEQSSTSHEVDKSYSSSSFSMPSTEMKASDMHDQLQIQLSKDLDTNISDRIRFYFHDFLLGSILFSLFLGHMLYSEQCNRKYIVETKRIAEYEVERIQLLTNISVLSSEFRGRIRCMHI